MLNSKSFAELSIIPQPSSVHQQDGKLSKSFKHILVESNDTTLKSAVEQSLRLWWGNVVVQAATDGVCRVQVDGASGEPTVTALGKEGYTLTTSTEGAVQIHSSAANGAFYGVQTLVQLLGKNADGSLVLPLVVIQDRPRFGWRGLMMDVSRHFMTKADVKRELDLMALYKQNVLHWHLTDDQGWRIEIKKYPKLTSVGSVRPESPVWGDQKKGDGKPYSGFYTQDDIREVVAYAAQRYITVMPEIEVPGHSSAALMAYPEFGNTDIPHYQPKTAVSGGIYQDVYGPQEETLQFLRGVFDEVSGLFPGEYIHVGGDEVPAEQWQQSPRAQEKIKQLGLAKPQELEGWFIRQVGQYLETKKRKLVGWDEIQNDQLPVSATIMVWRDWQSAVKALNHGNNIIMTPTSNCYFDYREGSSPQKPWFDMPVHALPLEKVYEFEPMPPETAPEKEKQVLGVQANVWTEYIWDMQKFEYMVYPRALAMAEVGWTPKTEKNWPDFQRRLEWNKNLLDRVKVNYRKTDGTPAQCESSLR